MTMNIGSYCRCIFGAVLVTALWIACSDSPTDPSDSIAPSKITGFRVYDHTDSSVTLAWMATGDDETTGTATRYEMKYVESDVPPSDWFNGAVANGLPEPRRAGYWQSTVVYGLSSTTSYYFSIRAADEDGNWSEWSEAVAVFSNTPPQPISDIRVVRIEGDYSTLAWTATGDPGNFDIQIPACRCAAGIYQFTACSGTL